MDQGDSDMCGALPCLPWSTWQYVNLAKHGDAYRDKLGGERDVSRRMVDECIRKADQLLFFSGSATGDSLSLFWIGDLLKLRCLPDEVVSSGRAFGSDGSFCLLATYSFRQDDFHSERAFYGERFLSHRASD